METIITILILSNMLSLIVIFKGRFKIRSYEEVLFDLANHPLLGEQIRKIIYERSGM